MSNSGVFDIGSVAIGSKGFIRYYWRAFVWLGFAVYTLVVYGLMATRRPNDPIDQLLIVSIFPATYRAFKNGFSPRKNAHLNSGEGVFFDMLVGSLLQLLVLGVIWPFLETIGQVIFL